MRKYLIAANWKMNLNKTEAISLAKEIDKDTNPLNSNVDVTICSPYIHIPELIDYLMYSAISVGAQNCNENEKGAFTGEISSEMIKSYGCEYVIIGHSERRQIYNENNELINEKIKIALKNELKVILCIGESLEERKSDKTSFSKYYF
jgi:triosephosphate isomerase